MCEGFGLGGRQSIVLDKSCEPWQSCKNAWTSARMTVSSMAVSLSSTTHMRTRRALYFSLGYLGFEARRSSLSDAQIMTNATPVPLSTTVPRHFHPWETPFWEGRWYSLSFNARKPDWELPLLEHLLEASGCRREIRRGGFNCAVDDSSIGGRLIKVMQVRGGAMTEVTAT